MATKKEEKKEEKQLTLLQKLLEIKKQVAFIKKDTKGHQYEYASPTAVLGKVVPLLNEYGVLLEQRVVDAQYERVFSKPNARPVPTTIDGKTVSIQTPFEVYETLVTLKFDMTWVDVETGDERIIPFVSQGSNGDDKGVGSAMTYAERYFLLKYFNIATDTDDPDWLANKPEAKPKAQQPAPQPKPKAQAAAPPAEKKPIDNAVLQTMKQYVKDGKADMVRNRVMTVYALTGEQHKELVEAGMTPID